VYGYDGNGSLTSKIEGASTTTYTYNLQNRLASADDGTNLVSYAYDPSGIRVQKIVNSTNVTDYLIDPYNPTGYAQVFVENDGVADTTANPDYFLYDGHGSVRQLTDSAGLVVGNYNYDAYGNALNFTPTDGLYYTGEMFDSNLGMQYLRSRWTDPATGRFNRQDEYPGNSSNPLSLHKYLYVHADPVNATDASGFFSMADMTATNSIRNIMSDVYLNVFDSVQMSIDASFSSMTMRQLIWYKTAFDVVPFLAAPVFKMFGKFIDDVWPRITRRIVDGSAGIQGRRLVGVSDILSTHYRKLGKSADAVHMLGEVGAGFTMRAKGASCVYVNPGVHGIDQIWEKGGYFYIVEAKGGTGKLAKGQMSRRWITDRINMVEKVDPVLSRNLDVAIDQKKIKGVVVRTRTKGKNAFTPMFVEREWQNIGLNSWSRR
jgi:RHS repeat-associated protein